MTLAQAILSLLPASEPVMYFRAVGNRIQLLETQASAPMDGRRFRQRVIASLSIPEPVPSEILAQLTPWEQEQLTIFKRAAFLSKRRERLLRLLVRSQPTLDGITTALTDPDVVDEIETSTLIQLQDWCTSTIDTLLDLRARPTRMSQPVVIVEDVEDDANH